MTWVAWRLTRTSAISAGALVVLAACYLVVTGIQLRSAFDAADLGACLATGSSSNPCLDAAYALHEQARTLAGGQPVVGLLALVPGLLGAFVGAPLVAREIETGTLRLAWTQSVTRAGWILSRTGVALSVVVAAQLGLSLALGFWRGPLDAVQGRLETNGYDVQGVVPIGYAILTFCLGVAAGVLVRRTIPALAVALTGFVLVRLVISTLVRPRLVPPVVVSTDGDPTATAGAWVLEERLGASGRAEVVLHPAEHFWPLQLLELVLLLGLSAGLLALAWYWLRRLAM